MWCPKAALNTDYIDCTVRVWWNDPGLMLGWPIIDLRSALLSTDIFKNWVLHACLRVLASRAKSSLLEILSNHCNFDRCSINFDLFFSSLYLLSHFLFLMWEEDVWHLITKNSAKDCALDYCFLILFMKVWVSYTLRYTVGCKIPIQKLSTDKTLWQITNHIPDHLEKTRRHFEAYTGHGVQVPRAGRLWK